MSAENGELPVATPREVNYSTSYAHAHSAQRLAGRVRAAPPRPVHRLKRASANGAAAGAAAGGASAPAPLPAGRALVKTVLSGDTIVVKGRALKPGQPAPEKVLTLSGLQTPRFARGRQGKDEPYAWQAREFLRKLLVGEFVDFAVNHRHEASGREYASIKFQDRDVAAALVEAGWAGVKEGNRSKDGKLHPERQALVELQEEAKNREKGMWNKSLRAASQVRDIDWRPNAQELVKLSQNGAVALRGVVEQVRDGSSIRVEVYGGLRNQPGAGASAGGGKKKKKKKGGGGGGGASDEKGAAVSALRHAMVTVHLAGVQCPRTPMPESVLMDRWNRDRVKNPSLPKPVPEQPRPFAEAAKQYVEDLLLSRTVGVRIYTCDKMGNLFGSLDFKKGNISVQILKNGLGRFVKWSARMLPEDQAKLLEAADRDAAAKSLRVHSLVRKQQQLQQLHASQEAKGDGAGGAGDGAATIYSGDFIGRVTQVISGDTVEVRDVKGNTERVFLASVQAPRIGTRRDEVSKPWAVEAREFMRKRVAGARVRVVVEYRRQPPAGATGPGARVRLHVTLLAGKQHTVNVAEELVRAGWATCVRHRVDDPRSDHYDALLAAEQDATKNKKGLHCGEDAPNHAFLDLTSRGSLARSAAAESKDGGKKDAAGAAGGKGNNNNNKTNNSAVAAKARQHLLSLRSGGAKNAVVEYVFSGSRLKVFLPQNNLMVSFAIAGVRCGAAPGSDVRPQGVRDPWAETALKLVRDLTMHQDVRVTIDDLDKGNNFLGSVTVRNKNLGLQLLEMGLAYVYPFGARNRPGGDVLAKTEEAAREAKKGFWATWLPPVEAKKEEGAEAEERLFDARDKNALVPVVVKEVKDACTLYVHELTPQNERRIADVEAAMRAFNAPAAKDDSFQVRRGTVCAAKFSDGAWYRVRVEKRVAKENTADILFIDYGNRDTVPLDSIVEIKDEQLRKTPPLARLYSLFALKAPPATSDDHAQAAYETTGQAVYERTMLAKLYHEYNGDRQVELFEALSPEEAEKAAAAAEKAEKAKDETAEKEEEEEEAAEKKSEADGDEAAEKKGKKRAKWVADESLNLSEMLLESGMVRVAKRIPASVKAKHAERIKQLKEIQRAAERNHAGMWEYGYVSDPEEEDERERRERGRV